MPRNESAARHYTGRCVFLFAIISVALSFLAFSPQARGGEQGRIFFPDYLPSNTIFCIVPPDSTTLEQDYSRTIFARLAALPEMGPFLKAFEESRRNAANDIAKATNVSPQLVNELVNGRLALAVMNVGLGRNGKPTAEFVLGLALQNPPDRKTVFSTVMAILNRPEIVRQVLESQGIDPNTPIRSLAQEETVPGSPPMLRIGPNIRITLIGNMVMIYHGPGADGIRKIFDAVQNPSTSLTRNSSFQVTYRGAEGKPGSSFCFMNFPRISAILDALNLGPVTRVADALGMGSVQSIGMSGAYHNEGVRQTLFLHTPSGAATGLMSALIPMPADPPVGMESFANIIPSPAETFLSMRVDASVLLREIPYIIDSLGAVTRPGGVSGMVMNERILGVPIADVLRTVGTDLVIRPHDDTQVLMFHNVDIASFEAVVARMEQGAGARFNSQNIGGYSIRYFNKRASLSSPLAPAFCLVPRAPGSPQGILYMASHPQAVVSLIREATAAREPLAATVDFRKASSGTGSGFSLYYYNGNTDCYRRVYNFLLPVLSLWSSSSWYPVDTGLLPTASTIAPAMFGTSFGIRCLAEGMQVQVFSPVGSGAILVQTLDKLVVSNPLVIGYVYSLMESWIKTLSAW